MHFFLIDAHPHSRCKIKDIQNDYGRNKNVYIKNRKKKIFSVTFFNDERSERYVDI